MPCQIQLKEASKGLRPEDSWASVSAADAVLPRAKAQTNTALAMCRSLRATEVLHERGIERPAVESHPTFVPRETPIRHHPDDLRVNDVLGRLNAGCQGRFRVSFEHRNFGLKNEWSAIELRRYKMYAGAVLTITGFKDAVMRVQSRVLGQ